MAAENAGPAFKTQARNAAPASLIPRFFGEDGLTACRVSGLAFWKLTGINPYGIPAGAELDALIHERCFKGEGPALAYSTDSKAADKVRSRIKSIYGFSVLVGETRLRPPRGFFARLESGPSTATEVLADSIPLALCRLALVLDFRSSAH
jgi:hypothetical protein